MADYLLQINIKSEYVSRVATAFERKFPIPTDEEGEPLYTVAQWVKIKVTNWMRNIVLTTERKAAEEAAALTVDVSDIEFE